MLLVKFIVATEKRAFGFIYSSDWDDKVELYAMDSHSHEIDGLITAAVVFHLLIPTHYIPCSPTSWLLY